MERRRMVAESVRKFVDGLMGQGYIASAGPLGGFWQVGPGRTSLSKLPPQFFWPGADAIRMARIVFIIRPQP